MIFIINAEIPDEEGDRKGDKKTIIVRKGPYFGLKLASVLAILTFIYFYVLSFTNLLPVFIDLRIITLFSLVPFYFVLMSIPKLLNNKIKKADIAKNNISSILLFLILVNSYLFYLIIIN